MGSTVQVPTLVSPVSFSPWKEMKSSFYKGEREGGKEDI